jgi:hypothetical protein
MSDNAGSLTAMNCPPAWAGEHSDTFAFILAGALSRVMLPDDRVMPSEEIADVIARVNADGPGPYIGGSDR